MADARMAPARDALEARRAHRDHAAGSGRVLGDTLLSSTTAAYAALPDAMKQRLSGLRNVHSYRFYRAKNARAQEEEKARGGDNCAAQHKATFDYGLPLRRLTYCTTVRGTVPA